jgi:hypothetical protein
MKYKCFITVLLFLSSVVSAEIYKCQKPNGRLAFSDKPCPTESTQETINIKKKSWESRLESQKSPSINIIDLISKEGETTIKYEFRTIANSTAFLRQANRLSNMPVVLMKIIKPKAGVLGRAEIKASNKPNPFFDQLKNRSVHKHPITSQSSNATSWQPDSLCSRFI